MYKPGGTIAEALSRIQNKTYFLPAIQREFVWKPEQIERLFDSLMQGYPNSSPKCETAFTTSQQGGTNVGLDEPSLLAP